jgi:hypothetical protein
VVEQALGAHRRVDAELLREIAEGATHAVLLAQDVDVAQHDGASVGLLERGDRAHERRLAGAVGSEEAIHPARNVERDVAEGAHAVGVGLGDAADSEVHRPAEGVRR